MQQFKIGDWVVIEDSIYRVHATNNGNHNISIDVINNLHNYKTFDVTLWQPKADEWCWFWDYDKQPEFGKATGTTPLTENSDFYMGNTTYPYTREHLNQGFVYCEPFLGKLPSFLKDTK